jgi:hypothetical protein
MGMRVDEARQNELAGYVDDLRRAARHEGRLNRRDAPVANGDVVDSIDPRSRTNDAAAAQQQIVTYSFRHIGASLEVAGAR